MRPPLASSAVGGRTSRVRTTAAHHRPVSTTHRPARRDRHQAHTRPNSANHPAAIDSTVRGTSEREEKESENESGSGSVTAIVTVTVTVKAIAPRSITPPRADEHQRDIDRPHAFILLLHQFNRDSTCRMQLHHHTFARARHNVNEIHTFQKVYIRIKKLKQEMYEKAMH